MDIDIEPIFRSQAFEKRLMVSSPDELPNQRIVAVVGDIDRAEMRSLVSWIEDLVSPNARLFFSCDVESMTDVGVGPMRKVSRTDSLVSQQKSADLSNADVTTLSEQSQGKRNDQLPLADDEIPDLLVILQGWSDEYSTNDVNRLFAFAPLARVVVCYGAWCESDGRNRSIWPLAVRCPVWVVRPRIEREWESIQNPDSSYHLPWSASREEVFTADQMPIAKAWLGSKPFAIDSPDLAYRQFLREAFINVGDTIDVEVANTVLFDVDPWTPARAQELSVLRNRQPHVNIIGLTSLASPELIAELLHLGVHQVEHKLGLRIGIGQPF